MSDMGWNPADTGDAGSMLDPSAQVALGDSIGDLPDSIAPNTDWGMSGDADLTQPIGGVGGAMAGNPAYAPTAADLNPQMAMGGVPVVAGAAPAYNPGQLGAGVGGTTPGGPTFVTGTPGQAVNMALTPPSALATPTPRYQQILAGIAAMSPASETQPAAQAARAPPNALPTIQPGGPSTAQRLAQIASGQIPARPAWQTIR